MSSQNDNLFKASLITLCFMILGMVLIGGLTRLTGSGLSIVEWKPITGIFPPLTKAEWMMEFSKYQQSPEFQKINFGMGLSEFQSIFFLEYIHRLWGRLIGIVLCIPTVLMIFKKQHRELWFLLILLWILGLAQGLMGWIMVKSGLIHDPHVSPYRLSAHLFLGFMIFGTALWMTLMVYRGDQITKDTDRRHCEELLLRSNPVFLWLPGWLRFARHDENSRFSVYIQSLKPLHKNKLTREVPSFALKNVHLLRSGVLIAFFLVLLTALFGGFVAGLKAGLIYNTFPLMGDTWIPRELLTQGPWWKDLCENPVSVQFLHRLLAITTVIFCGGLWVYQHHRKLPTPLKNAFNGMMVAVLLQLSLGILTLLLVIPTPLALLHQGVAFVVFGSLVYVLFILQYYRLTCTLPNDSVS